MHFPVWTHVEAEEKRFREFGGAVATKVGQKQPTIALVIVKSLVFNAQRSQLYRGLALASIVELFQQMQVKEQQSVIDFGTTALNSEAILQRVLAIELVRRLLVEENIKDVAIDPSELVHALARRARDVSPAVQAGALSSLSELLEGTQIAIGESILAPGALQPSMRQSEASRRIGTTSNESQQSQLEF